MYIVAGAKSRALKPAEALQEKLVNQCPAPMPKMLKPSVTQYSAATAAEYVVPRFHELSYRRSAFACTCRRSLRSASRKSALTGMLASSSVKLLPAVSSTRNWTAGLEPKER